MTREEILGAIKDLAKSQGYYDRLLRAIEEDETILDTLEEQNFNDVVDMVLYLESWETENVRRSKFWNEKIWGQIRG